MSLRVNAKWFDGLISDLKTIRGKYQFRINGLSTLSEEKVEKLKARGRNLFKVTPTQTAEIVRAATAALAQGVDVPAMLEAVGKVLHALAVRRLSTEGGDANWTQISAAYRAEKQAKGLDRRTGVATGTLLRELKAGSVVAVKR